MTAPTLDPVIMEYVDRKVDELLRLRGGQTFTTEHADRIDSLEAGLFGMQADKSLGRIFNGPLWLSGASVLDGTVTADKISVTTLEAVQASTGTLNVTGTLTMAASYPALSGARIVLTASMIAGYNSSDAQTFKFNIDGSGQIGIGATQATWTTAGVLTVPVAAIGSLTIADVGSGTFNSNFDAGTGRVRAGTALQRVELTSAGIAAYNTGGTQTFLLDATTGSMTHTGTYTIRSASSGTRIEVTNVGIKAFNGATQTFELLASNGSGFMGSSPAISWGAGSLTIPGGSITASTVTATQLNVSTLSSITANMGTITAGSITAGTITASVISTGTMSAARLSGGDLGGTIGLGGSSINVTSTGVITNSDGDSWGPNGITLVSAGTFGDAIKWRVSGVDKASIYADATYAYFGFTSGGRVILSSTTAVLCGLTATSNSVIVDESVNNVVFYTNSTLRGTIDNAGRLVWVGNLFPGNQTSQYLGYASGYLVLNGPVDVANSTEGGSTANWSAGLLAADTSYVKMKINGTLRRIPVYADA